MKKIKGLLDDCVRSASLSGEDDDNANRSNDSSAPASDPPRDANGPTPTDASGANPHDRGTASIYARIPASDGAALTFIALAVEVLKLREEQGIRGLDREISRYRCHIETAAFAGKLVTEVTAPDIREWLRTMAQKNVAKRGSGRKLSRQTISRCQSLISAIFNEAVECEIIELNPCTGVRAKKRVDESDTQEKWAFLTADEQTQIMNCESIPKADRLCIAFAIHTGLRQGEWRHLEREDLIVDGPEPKVVVRFAGRRKGEKLPPKSGKRRTVPLFGEGLAVAKEWLKMLPTYAPHNPEGLVFPAANGSIRQQGKPLGRGGTVRGHYQAAGVKLRPHLHWHALRHTFASNLVTGVYGRRWSMEEVQILMGHSSITITQRYAHLGEDAIKRAVRETVEAMAVPAVRVVDAAPDIAPEKPVGRFRQLVQFFSKAKGSAA